MGQAAAYGAAHINIVALDELWQTGWSLGRCWAPCQLVMNLMPMDGGAVKCFPKV